MRPVFLMTSAFALACGPTIENPDVEALDIDGITVLAYSDTPAFVHAALTHGPATVTDGCLRVDDAVVVWAPETLDVAEDLVARVLDGEELQVSMGGGEGAFEGAVDVEALCGTSRVWLGALDEPVIE